MPAIFLAIRVGAVFRLSAASSEASALSCGRVAKSESTLFVRRGEEPGDRVLDVRDANGFFQIGITTGIEGVLVIGFVAVGRIVENRDCGIKSPELLAKFDAGPVRESNIEDIKVKIDFLREFKTLRHAAGGENSVAAILQKCRHHQASVLMIIHVKNASLGAFHISFLPDPNRRDPIAHYFVDRARAVEASKKRPQCLLRECAFSIFFCDGPIIQ